MLLLRAVAFFLLQTVSSANESNLESCEQVTILIESDPQPSEAENEDDTEDAD